MKNEPDYSFSPHKFHTNEIPVVKEKKKKKTYTLNFDGGCVKNPGGPAIGSWVAYDEDKNIVLEGSKVECEGPEATNNLAEYVGAFNGIKAVMDLTKGDCLLSVKGDSKLVINQLNGVYKVHNQKLKVYHQMCMALLGSFEFWKATHVKREFNTYADGLGRKPAAEKD